MLAYTAWFQHRAAHKLNVVVRRSLGQRGDLTRYQRLAAFFARCCCCRKDKAATKHNTNADDIELAERMKTPPAASNVQKDSSSKRGRVAGRRHRWTTAHSHYALIGGFVFDTSNADVNILPNFRERLTLTPAGLLYLLDNEPNLLSNISEEHIRDKSKASNLAKTLVCLQALWFCVQCLVRFGQDLAISLLELNVFGYAICALLMYLLWWDKPLDIEEPTILSGIMANEMCALMCMRSFLYQNPFTSGGQMDLPELPYGVRYGSERSRNITETSANPASDHPKWYLLKEIVGSFKSIIPEMLVGWHEFVYDVLVILGREKHLGTIIPWECRLDWAGTRATDTEARSFSQYIAYPVDLDYPPDVMEPKQQATTPSPDLPVAATTSPRIVPTKGMQRTNNVDIYGFCLMLGSWRLLAKQNFSRSDEQENTKKTTVFVPRQPQPDYSPASVNLSHGDAIRWQLCSGALRRYCPQPVWFMVSGSTSHQDFPAYRSVYDRSPNWPSSQQLKFTKEDSDQPLLATWLGFSLAGLVYGGLHLLAWDAPFPSHTGYKLWCASGILLASSGFICTLFIATFVPLLWTLDFLGRTSFWQRVKNLEDRYKPLEKIVFAVAMLFFCYNSCVSCC